MASGLIGGDDETEKHRWEESNQVYSRKHSKKRSNSKYVPIQTLAAAAAAAATTTDENNSSLPPQRYDAVASDDSSSLSRPKPLAKGGSELASGNCLRGYTRFEDRVKISASSKSKSEVRELRRKLVSELDQVRGLMKKLEDAVDRFGSAIRVNSEVGSNSKPFRTATKTNDQRVGEPPEKEKRTPKENQRHKTDSTAGKESNKKLKSNGGKRDGRTEKGFEIGTDWHTTPAFKSCCDLLTKLMKHKFSWVFNKPVDVKGLGLHDYYTIIKQPMDLGTVKNRLNKNWYKSPREFAEDVRLTFSNAMLYNPKGQDVYFMAEQLSKMFEAQWKPIDAEFDRTRRIDMAHDAGLSTNSSRKAAMLAQPPAPSPPPVEMRTLDRSESRTMPVEPKLKPSSSCQLGRTPVPRKPKAREPEKRDMTYEEKQRLSLNLQSLPSEKLDNIVQIIRKRNPGIFEEDDEIEVDIASVDSETLWELDMFVANYKKSLSKNNRKAEHILQSETEIDNASLERSLAPAISGTPKGTEPAQNTAPKFTPVQGENRGDNVSGSGMSGGSSGGFQSSSSDSDSGSPSAPGSGVEH